VCLGVSADVDLEQLTTAVRRVIVVSNLHTYNLLLKEGFHIANICLEGIEDYNGNCIHNTVKHVCMCTEGQSQELNIWGIKSKKYSII
jgi:hypothetical protein